MKLGLLTGVLGDHDRAGAFDICAELGLDAVELGTGEFSSDWHVGLDAIVDDPKAVETLQRDLDSRGLEISALSCHGNPLHLCGPSGANVAMMAEPPGRRAVRR